MDKKLEDLRSKLTEKQLRFANYFIECGNAAEAAEKAGYSTTSSRQIGQENLTKPTVRAYIDIILDSKEKESIARQDEVLSFYTMLMRGEETEEIVCPDGVGGVFRQRKELDHKTRLAAAKELAKRYGIDKPVGQELNNDITIKLVTSDDNQED